MTTSRRLWIVVLATGLVSAGLTATSAEDGGSTPFFRLPDNPIIGGRLFMDKGCVSCHAIHGEGGTSAPDLGRVPAAWSFLGIAGVMWNHSPKMDEEIRRRGGTRPELTSDQMFQLIAFVYSLNYFGGAGDADEGERLLLAKRCLECHSVGHHGEGPRAIPLDRFQTEASPAFIASALWNASRGMTAEMKRRGVPRPVYEERDIVDILAFIRREAEPAEGDQRSYLPLGNAAAGERLFRSKQCVHCHAVRGEGGRIGQDLSGKRSGDVVSQMAGAMWNHGPEMWQAMSRTRSPFPTLSPIEMSDLITYLHFSSFVDPPGDPRAGARIFDEKGCGSCHGTEAGAATATKVSDMDFASAPEVIAAMWNHTIDMEKAVEVAEIAWPQFKPGEMEDLFAYVKQEAAAR